jgi:hypothetical protein
VIVDSVGIVSKDIGYTIVPVIHEYHCDFFVYAIIGENSDGTVYYNKLNYDTSLEIVDEISEAQVYLHGSIKWDGCSDWHFDEQDDCMLHFCSVEQAKDIGNLFERMYEYAKNHIPKWTEL